MSLLMVIQLMKGMQMAFKVGGIKQWKRGRVSGLVKGGIILAGIWAWTKAAADIEYSYRISWVKSQPDFKKLYCSKEEKQKALEELSGFERGISAYQELRKNPEFSKWNPLDFYKWIRTQKDIVVVGNPITGVSKMKSNIGFICASIIEASWKRNWTDILEAGGPSAFKGFSAEPFLEMEIGRQKSAADCVARLIQACEECECE
jgi:hypothetical protein